MAVTRPNVNDESARTKSANVRTSRRSFLILRFFFVYGPGRGQTLVPRLVDRILAGEEIVIEGDPGMRMNPLFAADNTLMYFADGKKAIMDLITAIKAAA